MLSRLELPRASARAPEQKRRASGRSAWGSGPNAGLERRRRDLLERARGPPRTADSCREAHCSAVARLLLCFRRE
eukprot:8142472-Alexandrium_andersonii.AAC.1